MKYLKICFVFVLSLVFCLGAGTVDATDSRRAKAARCWGNIKVVDAFEDFKVRLVDAGADLRVLIMGGPVCRKTGEWYFVDVGENFKVRFVDVGEDFTIQFFPIPGLN